MSFKQWVEVHQKEIMLGISVFILACVVLISVPASADYSKIIEYSSSVWDIWPIDAGDGTFTTPGYIGYMIFPNFESYTDVSEFIYTPYDTCDFYIEYNGVRQNSTALSFFEYPGTAGDYSGTIYIENDGTSNEYLDVIFNSWDTKGLTGTQNVRFGYSPLYKIIMSSTGSVNTNSSEQLKPAFSSGPANYLRLEGQHEIKSIAEYKANLTIISNEFPNYVESDVSLNRSVNGINYPSSIEVLEGSHIYLPVIYGVSGTEEVSVSSYPIDVFIRFGYPIPIYSHKVTYYIDSNYTEATPTPTPTPTQPQCDINLGLSFSKYVAITPVTEYTNGTLIITGDASDSITNIQWMIGPGPGSTINKYAYASFTNTSGGWYVSRNDLGITTNAYTTYSDALMEGLRFSDAGNYIVRVSVTTSSGCTNYAEKAIQVNPSSGVNVYFNFYDCMNHAVLESVGASISNLNKTGNTTYYGNPISVAASIGDTLSVYAVLDGYNAHHLFYTVPYPPSGGTHLEVPFYLCPTELGEIYPGNTTLIVNVFSQSTGNPINGAFVQVMGTGVDIDSGTTNGAGYTMLQVPFREGFTRVDVSAYGYSTQTQYLLLNNATSYEVTFNLQYSTTPTVTPTSTATSPTSPWTTYTPIPTETAAPTVTITSYPSLTVSVTDANDGGIIQNATVRLYGASKTDVTFVGILHQQAMTGATGSTAPLLMIGLNAYWVKVSKTGYYESSERFIMANENSIRHVKLTPIGAGVTVIPTSTSGGHIINATGGGDYRQMFVDWMAEHFGVDDWAAGILIGLIVTLIGAVFVGGCLAGYGSGDGAGLGAIVGGCFGWVAACLIGFIPIWALLVSIAFVGMAFFVWRGGGGGNA